MENRKLIVAFYILVAMVLWFLSRSGLQYVYLTFYQVRRFPGIQFAREALPFLIGAITFLILMKHPKANLVLDEVVSELRKVTWPTRPEVVRSTTVVIVCIAIASFILATFDLIWGRAIGYLLHS